MYRSASGKKVSLISPTLALGQVVHATLEYLSGLPLERRFSHSLSDDFLKRWESVSGLSGGFFDAKTEQSYKQRGFAMINQVVSNPGPLKKKTVRIKADLPYFWLSQSDGLILCGKIDWLEYCADTDSVRIIDFKTGKRQESPDSLQLPIYQLLTKQCQSRPVTGAQYWYLQTDAQPVDMPLVDTDQTLDKILAIGKKIKLHRSLDKLSCPRGGCQACKPYEAIVSGDATLVGVGSYGQELYALPPASHTEFETEIL